jgi:delta-aminolevulinic acid dehydratase/porphobilinogen synthase
MNNASHARQQIRGTPEFPHFFHLKKMYKKQLAQAGVRALVLFSVTAAEARERHRKKSWPEKELSTRNTGE